MRRRWVEAKRAFVALAEAHHGSTCAVLMGFAKGANPSYDLPTPA